MDIELPKYHQVANGMQPPNNNSIFTTQPMSEASRPASVIVINAGKQGLSLEPQRLRCPHCNIVMITHLEYHSVFRTHLVALLFCVTGLCCLVPLPYFIKGLKRLEHYCSNCNQFIGKGN